MAPWPDPWEGDSPDDDAYSRVTRPERYRLLVARADAWAEALVSTGLATAQGDVDVVWAEPDAPKPVVSRLARLVPGRAEALPLVLGSITLDNVPDAGIWCGVGHPAVSLGVIPDCGCDACDSGSDSELEALDAMIAAIVSGRFHQMKRRSTTVTVLEGESVRMSGKRLGRIDVDRLLAGKARGWTHLTGPSWLTSAD